ncbi:MAG: Hsp20/alpha crystallin family protein [Candidatus Omnitrophica bacterium]|nr:Hsp20/alpha crystallin family protein [Candidatus Omnitrophota bacterium]
MNIVKYRPRSSWQTLDNLPEEINRLFDFSVGGLFPVSQKVASLALDVWDDKENIYVEADLPGIDEKDIKLNVKGDVLSISGKKEESKEEKKKGYFHCERFQGSFFREVVLNSAVDTAKVKAKYKKGVLSVTLPKKEKEDEKAISIDVE